MLVLETFDRPPALDVLADALESLLPDGLPATEESASMALIGLRGVWARSVDPDDLLSRVKALNMLLRAEIPQIPARRGRDWAAGAVILFGLDRQSRHWNLVKRYHEAAEVIPYNESHFRQEIVPKILRQLARQLHEDSQNYIPRNRLIAPQLEISGDTPSLQTEEFRTRERSLHEESLSRLWEHVYGLRAESLAIARLKTWPENEHGELKLEEAREAVLWHLGRIMADVSKYIATYGNRIAHGEAEYSVESLARLAGWTGELPPELGREIRLLAAQEPTRAGFVLAARAAGIRIEAVGG